MSSGSVVDELNDRPTGMTVFESRLVNLLALLLVQERQQSEQIGLLSRAGFRPAEIATMLGTTRNTVNVDLSKQRAARNAKQRKKPKKR